MDHAYDQVRAKLTRKVRAELDAAERDGTT
jgi:hypothetical protein